jgi:hypothetical protein
VFIQFCSGRIINYNIKYRFLTILDKDSVKYIDYFLENEFINPDIEIFENVLKLIQNGCTSLKSEFKPTVKKVFYLYYTSVKNLPLPTDTISDIDKNVSFWIKYYIRLYRYIFILQNYCQA